MSYIHADTKDGAEFMKLMKQKSYNKKQAIRAFTLGMRGDAVHGAGPGGMSQFARHVTKHLKESVNEAKTVSIDGEELMNFLMKRFKYSKKKAIDVMKKHKMDTSFLKKESVNESSYTQRSILDFIKANKAAVESDPANIPRIKLFGPKQDSKYLNISLIGLAKIAKIVKSESVSVDEGFGGELKGKDREKFEKARKENAEQLGYKLTGKGDIREAIKFSKEEMAQLHQNGKLEKDGHTYVYKGK